MSDTFQTLADLIKINDRNASEVDGISDILDDAPLMGRLAAAVASNGTQHKYLKQSGAPTVGFRAVNAGRANSVSADTLVTVDLKLMDASFAVDMALADSYKAGTEAYIAREARRHLRAAMFAVEQQIINGTGIDADGFTGLAEALTLDGLADTMVVGASGTTAGTGSSVYLLRTSDLGTDFQAVAGNDGELEIGDSVVQCLTDADGKHYTGYWTPIQGYFGVQIGSAYSVGRICNLTEDSGKGLTDVLIYEALSRFPASRQPNLIVMNRRSQKQLRASRTATNATGAPAPLPKDVEGIEIIVTDAITSTETLLT